MEDLITWLRAQLDDDERKANSRYKPRPDGPRNIETAHLPGGDLRVRVDGAPPQMMTSQQYVDAFLEPNPDQRLLREVESKRRLVELHVPGNPDAVPMEGYSGWPDKPWLFCRTCGSGEAYEYPTDWPCATVRLLALPFSDRPGYQESWRP